jgi:hypothetical protein
VLRNFEQLVAPPPPKTRAEELSDAQTKKK